MTKFNDIVAATYVVLLASLFWLAGLAWVRGGDYGCLAHEAWVMQWVVLPSTLTIIGSWLFVESRR